MPTRSRRARLRSDAVLKAAMELIQEDGMDDEKQISDVDCGVLATRSTVPSDLGSFLQFPTRMGTPKSVTQPLVQR